MNKKETLYYDGSCPMCSAEIRRLGALSGPELTLVDIHTAEPESLPAKKPALLKALHLTDRQGQALIGVAANVAAWQHTRWGFAFRWMRWPGVRTIADYIYQVWATRRYERRYGSKSDNQDSRDAG